MEQYRNAESEHQGLAVVHRTPVRERCLSPVHDKGTANQGFCSTQVVIDRIPFADLKTLVETPLAEEDVDVRPTKSTYTDEEIWQFLSALCGASNATQFQALPRPEQKRHLFAAHEEGIGPRTLSRLTGVPYSIVQRATSDTIRYGNNVCDSIPGDEEYDTYLDDSEYEKCPEY